MDLIHPYPEQDPDEVSRAKPFLDKLERFLREDVDSDRIDREGEIPENVIQGLRELGAFGIKIPREYGGLGLSQLSYMKAIELVSSVDGSLTALLSAHQSIGVPQPLKMFGTDAQKKKYFPRLAKGAISAFALTEHAVGSDPAAMETTAIVSTDGDAWRSRAAGRRRPCNGAVPSGSTTRSRRRSAPWPPTPWRWRRWRSCAGRWRSAVATISGSRPRSPSSTTPKPAGGSSTTRSRSAAAAATKPRIRCARAGSSRCRSSASCATSAST